MYFVSNFPPIVVSDISAVAFHFSNPTVTCSLRWPFVIKIWRLYLTSLQGSQNITAPGFMCFIAMAVPNLLRYILVLYSWLVLAAKCTDYDCPQNKTGYCVSINKDSHFTCKIANICHLRYLLPKKENVTSL